MQGIGISENNDVRALRFLSARHPVGADEVGVQDQATTSKQKMDFGVRKFVDLVRIAHWFVCSQITTSFTRIFLHGQIFAR